MNASELELVQLVSLYAQVETIKIVRDKQTGKCKGYAFLEMATLADARLAVETLNGTTYHDKILSLSIKEAEPIAPKSFYQKVRRPGEAPKGNRRRIQHGAK